MKFCSMNGPSESEVESLLMSPCWGPTQTSSQDQYLLDGHKLLLEHELDSLPSDTDQKNSLDVLDNLLLNTSSLNALSDLKPLPPFTNYTGHLSINGISGHHYHAIAQRLPDESNNNYMQSAYHQQQHQQTQQQQQQQQHQQHQHQHHQQQQQHHHHHHQQQQQQQQQSSNPTSTGATTSIQLAASSSGSSPLSNVTLGGGSSSGGSAGGGLSNGGGGSGSSHSHSSAADHNIVSSSTCLPESVLSADAADACLNDVKLFADSHLDSKLYNVADSCVMASGGGGGAVGGGGGGGPGITLTPPSIDQVADSLHTSGVRIYKDLTEYVDMNSIDDIAAIIGSAIADTTVPNQLDKDDGTDTRDSWMDLDAWIDGNCIQQEGKLVVSQQDAMNDFILPHSPVHTSTSSTLQSLLTHGYMPLLQNRLQNGPPTTASSVSAGGGGGVGSAVSSGGIKSEAPSSTSTFCNELTPTATSSSSPPGSVVSTTDNLMINPRYLTNASAAHQYQLSGSAQNGMSVMKSDGICSPDMLGNYPHTTTATPTGTPKTKRARSQKKSAGQAQSGQMVSNAGGQAQPQQLNAISPSTVNSFSANDLSGLLGKEKPVHRCSICNRGFLNKSNIKVHLRTHTGEKPFRCDVCAKAFRQKAHLLKHQQIHKRIGRD